MEEENKEILEDESKEVIVDENNEVVMEDVNTLVKKNRNISGKIGFVLSIIALVVAMLNTYMSIQLEVPEGAGALGVIFVLIYLILAGGIISIVSIISILTSIKNIRLATNKRAMIISTLSILLSVGAVAILIGRIN